MPYTTEIECRDRAVVAFTILTGARDGAVASMRLRHVELDAGRIIRDARHVKTKFSKSFPTFFFPVGGEAEKIVSEWVSFLRADRCWGADAPLFPATRVAQGTDRQFKAVGLDLKGWSNSTPIRAIFRQAFEAADLPYFSPHSFRKTLVALGERICRTPEEFKAWSQNLGHEDVLTTFNSYGAVPTTRQGDLIRNAGMRSATAPAELAALTAAWDRYRAVVDA